jgi:hypothetical protein
MNQRKNRKFPVHVVIIFLITCVAYLPVIPKLGLYYDDWYLVHISHFWGIDKLPDIFTIDRPFIGYIKYVQFWLFGEHILLHHLAAVLIRFVGGIVFYNIIRRVFEPRRNLAVWMTLIFLTYPGFLRQPNAMDYIPHLLGILFGLVSIDLTILMTRADTRIRRYVLMVFSIGMGLLCYLTMEWMIGLEGFRLLLIVYLQSKRGRKIDLPLLKRVLRDFAPAFFGLAIFLVWRLLIFKDARASTDLLTLRSTYLGAPLFMVSRLLLETLKSTVNVTLLAWFVPLYQSWVGTTYADLFQALVFAGVGISIVLLYLRLVNNGESGDDLNPKLGISIIWIGLLAVLASVAPIVLANRSVIFEDTLDRFTLTASIGASIFIAGIAYTIANRKIFTVFLAAVVGLSIGVQHLNAQYYSRLWQYERALWWQFTWRAPDIQEDTVVIPVLPNGYSLHESYEVWGPLNLIYNGAVLGQPFGLMGEAPSADTLNNIQIGAAFGRTTRKIPYSVDLGNALVVSIPGNGGCMHVLDGTLPELSEFDRPITRLIAPRSDIDLVKFDANDPTVPGLFGKEPAHDWCHYYQKASLARQRGDWEEIVRLGDEAIKQGYQPNDPAEWMPFYYGYVRTDDIERANELGGILRAEPGFIELYCHNLIDAELTEDERNQFLYLNLCPGNYENAGS